MTGRYEKKKKADYLQKKTGKHVANWSLSHWIDPYGVPDHPQKYNGF